MVSHTVYWRLLSWGCASLGIDYTCGGSSDVGVWVMGDYAVNDINVRRWGNKRYTHYFLLAPKEYIGFFDELICTIHAVSGCRKWKEPIFVHFLLSDSEEGMKGTCLVDKQIIYIIAKPIEYSWIKRCGFKYVEGSTFPISIESFIKLYWHELDHLRFPNKEEADFPTPEQSCMVYNILCDKFAEGKFSL